LRPAKNESQENIETTKMKGGGDPSSSLDELELMNGDKDPKTAPVSIQRRARSSLGGNRKSSAKGEGTIA
jgi:hypothetical protein